MIQTAEQLIPYIEGGATLEDIKRLLLTEHEVIPDTSYQILSRKADVLRAIDRLQEPIPLMKIADAPAIDNIISDLYSQFMMLTELSNVQTIMTNYQEDTKDIINAINLLDEERPETSQHLIDLIRSYKAKTANSQLTPKVTGGTIIETVGLYLNLEKELLDTLTVMEQARRSNPLFPVITQGGPNQLLSLESFQRKIEEYVELHKGKFPLTQIQGILQGARMAFHLAEKMRFNSGPYEPIHLIQLFGVDLIARLIAYAKIEASFLIPEVKE